MCRSLVGSEVPRELTLFTAVEGRMVEEGAGRAVPLRPLILLLVCSGLHNLTARICDEEEEEKKNRVSARYNTREEVLQRINCYIKTK